MSRLAAMSLGHLLSTPKLPRRCRHVSRSTTLQAPDQREPLLSLYDAPLTIANAFAQAEPDWDAIAKCESGGTWNVDTGNGYYGSVQFSPSTWRANCGAGNPADTPREEQIRIARNLLESQGMRAWPVCG
jgi:hypothetical protein